MYMHNKNTLAKQGLHLNSIERRELFVRLRLFGQSVLQREERNVPKMQECQFHF